MPQRSMLPQRPYDVWIRANLGEFLFGAGVTVTALGLAAVLLTTDLIGMNRGEVLRLWLFLACFFPIPAAYACARLPGTAAIALVPGTSILHGTIAASMIGFVP